MDLEIYWTEFSKRELKKIFNYYSERVSSRVARKITKGIFNATIPLKRHAEIGTIEPLLVSRKEEFRYLVHKNYKIIYWFNKNKNWIEINDVFDTRQNPSKMDRNE